MTERTSNFPKADVAIVGGGPAGLMAAIATEGANAVIFEKMPTPGRKLLLSGGERCNLTNDLNAKEFLAELGKEGRFASHAVGRFPPDETRRFFAKIGVRTVTETDGRCFAKSGRAGDVLSALVGHAKKAGVRILTGAGVESIQKASDSFVIVTQGGTHHARRVVLATGGLSYPQTGSSGDGHRIAKALGHRIEPGRPGEVAFTSSANWLSSVMGISLANVVVEAIFDKKVAESASKTRKTATKGDFLFTHFGVSGPVIMDLSRLCARENGTAPSAIRIDLVPNVSPEELEQRLVVASANNGRQTIKGSIAEYVPARLVPVLLDLAEIGRPTLADLSATTRRRLVGTLKDLTIPISGTLGFASAIVTVGGVDRDEIDPKSMESRIVPGLFLAGELIDLDGPRGGFNLQIAWSTGRLAGESAAKSLR